MRREKSDLEQRVENIVKGQNQKSDARPVDDAYERLKSLVGSGVAAPRFVLSTEEKLGLFDSILECLESGDDNESIAKNVVACFEDKLAELDPSGRGC